MSPAGESLEPTGGALRAAGICELPRRSSASSRSSSALRWATPPSAFDGFVAAHALQAALEPDEMVGASEQVPLIRR